MHLSDKALPLWSINRRKQHNRISFWISNKDIYSRTLPYAEKHKAARKIQIGKKKKREKRKEKILNTKERAKEHRERVTGGDSPSP